jgi:hypothetical protein
MLPGVSLLHHAPEGLHLDQERSGYHLGIRYCSSDAYLCSMLVIFQSIVLEFISSLQCINIQSPISVTSCIFSQSRAHHLYVQRANGHRFVTDWDYISQIEMSFIPATALVVHTFYTHKIWRCPSQVSPSSLRER